MPQDYRLYTVKEIHSDELYAHRAISEMIDFMSVCEYGFCGVLQDRVPSAHSGLLPDHV